MRKNRAVGLNSLWLLGRDRIRQALERGFDEVAGPTIEAQVTRHGRRQLLFRQAADNRSAGVFGQVDDGRLITGRRGVIEEDHRPHPGLDIQAEDQSHLPVGQFHDTARWIDTERLNQRHDHFFGKQTFRLGIDLSQCLRRGEVRRLSLLMDKRVVFIHHEHDSGRDRELGAGQMPRIPGAIKALMMARDDLHDLGRDMGHSLQQINAIVRMSLELKKLRLGEVAAVSENSERDVLFAEVVEEAGHADEPDHVRREPEMTGDDHGKGAHVDSM